MCPCGFTRREPNPAQQRTSGVVGVAARNSWRHRGPSMPVSSTKKLPRVSHREYTDLGRGGACTTQRFQNRVREVLPSGSDAMKRVYLHNLLDHIAVGEECAPGRRWP